MRPLFSIGIVTIRARFQLLRRLLKSLKEQNYPQDRLEILLVPNMAALEWKILAEALGDLATPALRVLDAHHRTLGAARNEILISAKGSLLLFLDDDCWLGDLAHLSRRETLHNLHPSTVIGGRYVTPPENLARNFYNELCNLWFEFDEQGWKMLGGNTSYPLDLIRQHQFTFDSERDYGGNENPLNLNLWKARVSFLKSESLGVLHEENLGLVDLGRKAFRQGSARALEARDGKSRPALLKLLNAAYEKRFRLSQAAGFFLAGEMGFLSAKIAKLLKRDELREP